MAQTIITAGNAVDGISATRGDDGTLVFKTGASGSQVNALTLAADGTPTFLKSALVADPTNAIGYSTGSGGTVTQLTSRTTAVTINKPTGSIRMFSAAGSTVWNSFVVNNSHVALGDIVVFTAKDISNYYTFTPQVQTTGQFIVNFVANSISVDAPLVSFAIIKGSAT
jgi:hypothetical protein